ncbi:MAG: NB-ARC domain-containing protein [Ilumatobacteraceae bacterium]
MTSSIRTLLFSDVEGSTSLLERIGEEYGALIARHRIIVRRAIVEHGGVEHGTEGDSFFVSFDTPAAAVAAAVQMQLGLQVEPWPDGCALKVRIGLHAGEVVAQHGEFVGLAINHAARVASAAHGNQLILSDDVRRLTPRLPPGVELKALGEHRLRDLGTVALFQVLHQGLVTDFPPLRALPTSRTNLPRFAGTLMGATEVFDGLLDLVRSSQLVTLTGTGGVGKTRLAIELAHHLTDEYEHGGWLVELAQLSDPEAVVGAVSNEMSMPLQPDMSPVESMVDWLRRRSMVMVFDNCEHLINELAEVVTAIIDACADVRIIATSREPLSVSGEHVHRVASLEHEHAADLFVEQLTAADRSISIGPAERAVIEEICQRLDGIPLAIQLAAARARSMSLDLLLARLGDRFRLLRGGSRGGRDRHQTLLATVTWSYRLLTPEEQVVFDCASVFAGDFDLLAAEHICARESVDPVDVLDLLQGLVDKSMIVPHRSGTTVRYRVLETLRQYGEDRLDERDMLTSVRDRHLEWYSQVARSADRLRYTEREPEADRIFEAEWDNFRSAHTWTMSTGQLELAAELCTSCFAYGAEEVRSDHLEWVERTLAAIGDEHPSATRMYGQAAYWRSFLLGDDATGDELGRRGIELARDPSHPETVACWASMTGTGSVHAVGSETAEWAFSGMSTAVENIEDPDTAGFWQLIMVANCAWAHLELIDLWFERLRQTVERVRIPSLQIWFEQFIGQNKLFLDPPDVAGAMPHYVKALDRARQFGHTRAIGTGLRGVAMISCALGHPAALEQVVEALDHLFQTRHWQKAYQALESAALALAAAGHLDDAAVVLGFLDHERPNAAGMEIDFGFRDRTRDLIADAPHRERMIGRGASMSRDEVVMFVLTESAARTAGSVGHSW